MSQSWLEEISFSIAIRPFFICLYPLMRYVVSSLEVRED